MVEAYYNCLHCMNRNVRILTKDGGVHEGTIVNVDRQNVYLKKGAGKRVTTSAFYPSPSPYNYGGREEILTLSLFTLLAIALI